MFEVSGQKSKINPAILAALICLLRVTSEQLWPKLRKGRFWKAAQDGVPESLRLYGPSVWNAYPIPPPHSFPPASCWAFRILPKPNLLGEAFPHARPQAKGSFLQLAGLTVQIVASHTPNPRHLVHCGLRRARSSTGFVSLTQSCKTPSFVNSGLGFSLSGWQVTRTPHASPCVPSRCPLCPSSVSSSRGLPRG